jgi:hypothetical protein
MDPPPTPASLRVIFLFLKGLQVLLFWLNTQIKNKAATLKVEIKPIKLWPEENDSFDLAEIKNLQSYCS